MTDELILILCGALAMLATAGFMMMNIALCRAHASATIGLMNFTGACMAILAFYFIGHNLMYADVGEYGFAGSPRFFYVAGSGNQALWLYRTAIAVFAITIILGAVAERMKIISFIIFSALFAGFIYPVSGAWVWGGGWLRTLGFHDYGGAAVLHMAAGCAGLAGIKYLGPRAGRYAAQDGRPIPFPGSNVPLAMLGAMLAITGALGLYGGQGGAELGKVAMNALLAAAAGTMGAFAYVNMKYRKVDVTIVINGAIAGIVSVAGGADGFSPFFSIIVGGVGGAVCAYMIPVLDKYKMDDPVGTVPAHLFAGAWGALAASFLGNPFIQILGIAAIALWSLIVSAAAWRLMANTIGLRCPDKSLRHGVDVGELGLEAYPDFPVRTAGRPDITQVDKF